MQISKKRILGAAGLTLVAGTTVVAHNIQTPSAYAESADVQIRTVVISDNLNVEIEGQIQDGSETSKSTIQVPVNLTDIVTLRYTVTASQEGKESVMVDSKTVDVTENGINVYGERTVSAQAEGDEEDDYSGIYGITLPLREYADSLIANHGYDGTKDIVFTLRVVGTGYGGATDEDSISFTYGAVTIDPGTNINPDAPEGETNVPTDENGDPEITIGTGEETETIHVVVRDPVTGEVVWEGDFPAGTDVTTIKLPFAENGIGSGNYIIEVTAYDENGNVVGTSSLDMRYVRPDGLDDLGLPNTGSITIAGLNIARADFLISGAIIFFLVAAGGIFLIRRKQTRK
ncbi:hypothetical protein IJ096_03035 [Candidatus Saccharibacteria bacterium]|nr:hypothetical protein [Candidatus Saccharibacteria bacterium]